MSSTVLINKDLVAVRVGYRKTRGTLRTLIAFGEACNALALHVALKISARAAHSELRMQAARKTQCNARTRSAVRHEHWSTHHHRKCVAPRWVISQLIARPLQRTSGAIWQSLKGATVEMQGIVPYRAVARRGAWDVRGARDGEH
ncbi:MAG: hypothetical protein ACK5ZZ_03360 [Gemmatimonadaceae bacterium]|jgi:hypothetical protein